LNWGGGAAYTAVTNVTVEYNNFAGTLGRHQQLLGRHYRHCSSREDHRGCEEHGHL
jgi:hypothetical protein